MKNIRKSLLVALFAALTLSACGGNGDSSKGTTPSTPSTPSVSTPAPSTPTPSTPAPSTPSVSTPAGVNKTEIVETGLARVVLPQHNNNVVDPFTVPTTVTFTLNNETYNLPITWTSDKSNVAFEEVDGVLTAVLTRPAKEDGDVVVRLTATVEFEGESKSKTFKVTVLASQTSANLWGEKTEGLSPVTHEEFFAASVGTKLQIKGIVTGAGYNPNSSGDSCYCIFIEDEDGGYYCYRIPLSKTEYEQFFAIGNEVIVEGPKGEYNGLQQLSGNFTAIEIVSTGNTVEPTEATSAAKGSNFADLQSTYVTVLGTYVVEDGTKYLQVGSNQYEIYQSEKYNCNNFAETEEQLKAVASGDTVRVTALVGMYTSPQFYLRSIVKTDEVIEDSDADKAAMAAAEALKAFDSNYYENVEIALPEVEGAELTYSLNAEANTEVFNLNTTTKVLEITPTDDSATATLTITAKVGEETVVETIEISAATQLEIISLAEANEIASKQEHNTYTETEYYIKGTLDEITNETYGNTNLLADGASLYIYGMYKDGKKYGEIEGDKPEAGDIVILKGKLGTFNGTNQMKNAVIHEWYEVLTTTEAAAIALEYDHNTYSDEKYYVRGTIDEVYQDYYGNMYLDSKTLTVYGTYSADGVDKYGDMTGPKPDQYDEVLFYGILGTFNGAPQMKNAWIMEFVAKDAPAGGDTDEPGTGDVDTPVGTPSVIDFNEATGFSTPYGEYKDVKVGDYSFYLSCGNQYVNESPKLAVVGLNKDANISKSIALPDAVATALGDKVVTGNNAVNAVLEMKFDVNNVNGVTYNFTKIRYASGTTTNVYILRSVDGGNTYEVVANCTSGASLSYVETETAASVRYALVVTGYADASYAAQARVSTIEFTLAD